MNLSLTVLLVRAGNTINRQFRRSTGFNPFFLLHGHNNVIGATQPSFPPHQLYTLVRENLILSKKRMKDLADLKRCIAHNYGEGDWVYLSTAHWFAPKKRHKLAPRFIGPFQIICKTGELTYLLQIPGRHRFYKVVHTVHLKPFHTRRIQNPENQEETGIAVENVILDGDRFRGKSLFRV